MRQYPLYQVDAFSQAKLAGNPAGVVFDADTLTAREMQAIARELNNSETAFVLSPDADDHEVRLRFFTPTIEVPSCGHATVATAHVLEGSSDNYIFENDLREADFAGDLNVFTGPMVTVLGTSLQNRDVLEKFQIDWKTVGLEMEGGHYQRAINAAIIQGNISEDVKLRYAYYASDNPLLSGETLASGSLGSEGVTSTYMITKAIVHKILNG